MGSQKTSTTTKTNNLNWDNVKWMAKASTTTATTTNNNNNGAKLAG